MLQCAPLPSIAAQRQDTEAIPEISLVDWPFREPTHVLQFCVCSSPSNCNSLSYSEAKSIEWPPSKAQTRDSHDSKRIFEYWKQDSSLHPHITNLYIQISPTPISHWFNHITLQHWMNECPPSIGLQIQSLSSLYFLVARPKRKNLWMKSMLSEAQERQ